MSNFIVVLDRVQSDYAFYVRLQSDPNSALAEYELTADERAALSDPKRLADAIGHALPLKGLTVTISGKHDWVNRQPKRKNAPVRAAPLERMAQLVLTAENANIRRESTLRLIQLFG